MWIFSPPLRKYVSERELVFLTALFAFCQSTLAIEHAPGWPVTLSDGSAIFSSPTAFDLDGDRENGLEIIVATANGKIHTFKSDGTPYWKGETPNANCSEASSGNKLLSSPAVGYVNGDSIPIVVVGYGGINATPCGGGIALFHGQTGERIHVFDVQRDAPSERIHTVFSTPALYDTNGDGKLEIAFGSFARKLYLLQSNGKRLIYSLITADTVWSSPAFAKFEDDTFPSLLIGTDISRNDLLQPPTPDGGYFYRLRTVASTKKQRDCSKVKNERKRLRCALRQQKKILKSPPQKFGFRNPTPINWYEVFDQTIFSAPVIADVLPGNHDKEIIIGSGCFFPQNSSKKRGKWLKVLGSDGKLLSTLPAPGCSESQPTVGDLYGDGTLQIVASFNAGGEDHGKGYVTAWDPVTANELWSTAPTFIGNDENASFKMAPIIGDINGDGKEEIIIINGAALHILRGDTGEYLPCESELCRQGESKIRISSGGRNTPALADITGDLVPELLVASGDQVYLFSNLSALESNNEAPTTQRPFHSSCPMWRCNPSRTGEANNAS